MIGHVPTESAGRLRGPAVLLIVLLTAGVTALVMELAFSDRPARADIGRAGMGHVFVVAGQVTDRTYGLYLVDTEAHRICMYQWLPSTRKLRLSAVRNYTYDLRLDEFNTEQRPSEIKRIVEKATPLDANGSGRP